MLPNVGTKLWYQNLGTKILVPKIVVPKLWNENVVPNVSFAIPLIIRIRIRYTLLSHKQRNYSVVLKHLNNLHHSTHLQPIFNIRHLATWNYEIIINNSKYHTFVYHIIINITLSSTTFYCTISLICSVPFSSDLLHIQHSIAHPMGTNKKQVTLRNTFYSKINNYI